MKKRIISLILASAMLLSLTSCSKKEQTLDVENMTLEEYIDKVELPKNLTISIDPATVTDQTTVYTYDQVEFVSFDAETLKESFLQNPVTEELVWAQGLQYIAETEEVSEAVTTYVSGEVDLNDLEKAKKQDIFSFSYGIQLTAEGDTLRNLASSIVTGYMDPYQDDIEDLNFATQKDIENQIVSLFHDLGVPDVQTTCRKVFDLGDLQAMYNNNKEQYEKTYEALLAADPESVVGMSSEYDGVEPQKNDECYWFRFRQLIDGIPINSDPVALDPETDGLSDMVGGASSEFLYTTGGIVQANIISFLKQPTQRNGTEVKVVSASNALNSVINRYQGTILTKPYEVETLELVYVKPRTSSEMNQACALRPYWVVRVSYPLDNITAYDFVYIDAVTGEYSEISISGYTRNG